MISFARTWRAVVHGDCYVTIIVYLHKTPVYPNPSNKTCYVMIAMDRSSLSTIILEGIDHKKAWLCGKFVQH